MPICSVEGLAAEGGPKACDFLPLSSTFFTDLQYHEALSSSSMDRFEEMSFLPLGVMRLHCHNAASVYLAALLDTSFTGN